jgi:crotonobetainyl-CoA:carnitine CoA-transferase CaiB-like acyl-CoA transferase
MARAGLDHETLSAERRDLVSCRIGGIGRGDVAGYDFLAQAMGGLMSITGDADGEPRKIGVALVDVMTGLHAAIGILAGLRHRDRTGEGQLVEVDLLSTTLFALANQASNWLTAGVVAERMGNRHPSIAPYETLRAADGPLVVAVGNDEQFVAFCEVLGVPELAAAERFTTNAARVTNREPLVEALERALAAAPAAAWIDRLGARGIPCGMVNQVDQAFALARAVGLDPLASFPGVDTVANPLALSETPVSYRMPPPGVGEHDAEVRAEVAEDRPSR